MYDPPPGGNGNGRFDPGESGQLVVTLRNLGNEEAQSVTAKLRSGYSQFQITDSLGSFGTIPAGASRNNDADRFAAYAQGTIPPGTRVPCTLYVHSDNWAHDWTYVFRLTIGIAPVPGQYIITLDTGTVALSVCGIGSIGFDEPTGAIGGIGFQVPKAGANALYFGSVMAGNDGAYLVDHFYSRPANGPTNKDWRMTDSFRFIIPPTPADEHWVNTMSDAGHPGAKGLSVEQHWYMNATPGYSDWAIGVFDFKNNGSGAINGLYVGMIGDFDIGSTPTANIAGSDTVRRSVWMCQSSSENPTVGFVLLDPTRFANLTAVDHALYVYPSTAMTDTQKYQLLNGTIVQRQSNRSYDWSIVASAGPFNLATGATQRVAFAVVGANSRSNWYIGGDSAQRWYDANLLGIASPRPWFATAERPLFLSPNPFFRSTMVNYFTATAGPVELCIFDAAGREVEQVSFTTPAGASRLVWQPRGLAPGVYFLKARLPDRESVAKVLLLD